MKNQQIKYGKTYPDFIDWKNVTLLQFDSDYQKILSGEYLPNINELNADRLLVAMYRITSDSKLQQKLFARLALLSVSLVDYSMLHKALQMPGANLFFHTGKFITAHALYIDHLDMITQSHADNGNLLSRFYIENRNKFSKTEFDLFVNYVDSLSETQDQTPRNKKIRLQNSLRGIMNLNPPELELEVVTDPEADAMAALEQRLNEALKQENAEQESKQESQAHPTVLPVAQRLTPVIQPMAASLRVDTEQTIAAKFSPIKTPVLLRNTTLNGFTQQPAKGSVFSRLRQKWNTVPGRYKLAAAGFVLLGLSAVLLGIVLPASLVVTVPLLKISSSTLLIASGAGLAATTLAGHALHVNSQAVPALQEKSDAMLTQTPVLNANVHDDEVPEYSLENSSVSSEQVHADSITFTEMSADEDVSQTQRISPSSISILDMLRATSGKLQDDKSVEVKVEANPAQVTGPMFRGVPAKQVAVATNDATSNGHVPAQRISP